MVNIETNIVNRKSDIISAAIEVFAEVGYFQATTAQVAERAQISQPYIFRFFPSKEALLLTALEVSWTRVIKSFRIIAESAAPEELEIRLARAYEDIMDTHPNEVLLQMQTQTIQDDLIRETMHQGLGDVRRMVLDAFRSVGFLDAEERTMQFLARGLLCNISFALEMPELKEIGPLQGKRLNYSWGNH